MPRVTHVKKARRALPDHGVEVGDEYYWWAFRVGRSSIKRYSKTYPKPSQLTMSEFLSQVYAIQERIEALEADENLESERDEIVDEIRALGEEQSDKLSNMPDSLQQSPTGELLQGRADECERWADLLEGVNIPEWVYPDDEGDETEDDEDDPNQEMRDALEELQGCTYEGE